MAGVKRVFEFLKPNQILFGVISIALSILTSCAGNAPAIAPIGHTYYKQLYTKNGPIRLFIRDEGKGKPIILLHGFGANIFTWRYLYPELTKSNRVIAVDMKGFGQSDKPYDDAYSPFDQADLIVQLIEHMRLKNLTLVGHSFGGGVALATYFKMQSRNPKIIKRLALLDSLAYKQPIPFFLHVMRMPIISDLGIAMIAPEVHTRASLAFSYHKQHRITQEAINNYAQPYYSYAGAYAAKRTAEQIQPDDLDNYITRYPTIKVPTLLIWCKHDRVVPVINGLKLYTVLPNSDFQIIQDCGHIPQEESPTETVSKLLKFMKKNK